MDRKNREAEEDEMSRGQKFCDEVNDLLDNSTNQFVYLDPYVFGPEYEKTIKELSKENTDLNAREVFELTVSRLSEEQKAIARPNIRSNTVATMLKHFDHVSVYLSTHKEVDEAFSKLKV